MLGVGDSRHPLGAPPFSKVEWPVGLQVRWYVSMG